MGKYKNKLGLEGIARIEELRPQKVGLFFGRADEFVHIADTLKGLKRQRKSLTDYIENAEHRDAILRDLYRLRDLIALELAEERAKPSTEQLPAFIDRRDYFLATTVPFEESQLLAWEPPPESESRFELDQHKGFCLLTYQNGALTKLKLQFEKSGVFSIDWKQAGENAEKIEPIEKELHVKANLAVTVNLRPPREGGTIYISNRTRNVIERVPVS